MLIIGPILFTKLIDILFYTLIILFFASFIISFIFSILAIKRNNGKKLAIFILVIIVLILFILTLKMYSLYRNLYPRIDYSCNIDADCEIKNLGNLCGYYPACVNKNFKPNPPEFKNNPFCGFSSIDSCKCVKNLCRGSFKGEFGSPYNLS